MDCYLMDPPELGDHGENWTNYGSWVLEAIDIEGSTGILLGSETQPTHPKQLEGRGPGWAPQSDEERDEVAVWQTADNMWRQRAAMAHHLIISGLPDSILMLCMHLETPHETFAYLENRYGSIPRMASWLHAEEAMQQNNSSSEQNAASETILNTSDSHDEPDTLPGEEGGSPDSSNNCAEIETGYLTPESEVIDVQGVEVNPLVDTQRGERTRTLDPPDKRSQYVANEVTEGRDILEWRSEAPKLAGNTTRQCSRHPVEYGSQMSVEHNERVQTNGETIANVPDPPHTQVECPILQDPLSVQMWSATTMELKLPCTRRYSEVQQGGQLSAQSRSLALLPDLSFRKAWPPDRHTKRSMPLMADSKGQHPEWETKQMNDLPVSPEPPPTGVPLIPWLYRVPRRRGRVKSSTESVSYARTRRNAYHSRAVPMRLLPPPSTSSKWSIYLAGGLQTMSVCYNKVRSARRVETRGDTHRIAGIPMPLLQTVSNPSKQLWNITNAYWWQGVSPGLTLNNEKWSRNLRMAKRPPCSSGRKGDNTCTGIYLNGLPAPSKPARYGLSHPPGTLRDPHRRGRIKTRAKNVSRSETRASKASKLTTPIPPPRKLARLLRNVANTYWRQGVPPGRTQNDNKPVIFKTAALAITVQGQGARALQPSPKREVATMRRGKHSHTTLAHNGLEAALAAIILVLFQYSVYIFSIESYILHPS
ncbi:hypothetical protein EDC04DRAFT_3096366 [Pisolithus marmoratus]|nr:hypothetical protein EDC04DRAFT_3096366 [Pisolithus marmoratus]